MIPELTRDIVLLEIDAMEDEKVMPVPDVLVQRLAGHTSGEVMQRVMLLMGEGKVVGNVYPTWHYAVTHLGRERIAEIIEDGDTIPAAISRIGHAISREGSLKLQIVDGIEYFEKIYGTTLLPEHDTESRKNTGREQNRPVRLPVDAELFAEILTAIEGEPHVCTCGPECSDGFEDRCRFEALLRRLLGG